MQLLEYCNPRTEWHEKIENANLEREDVICRVIPKMLSCEICNQEVEHVWEDANFMRADGTFIRYCSSCSLLIKRFSKYPDDIIQQLLEA